MKNEKWNARDRRRQDAGATTSVDRRWRARSGHGQMKNEKWNARDRRRQDAGATTSVPYPIAGRMPALMPPRDEPDFQCKTQNFAFSILHLSVDQAGKEKCAA